MATTAARVVLDVLPDLSNFGKELSNGIARSEPQAKSAAEREGRTVGRSFGSSASRSAREEADTGFAHAGHAAGERFSETAKESTHALAKGIFAGIGAVGAAEVVDKSLEAADQLEGANIKIEGSFGESSKTVQSWAQGMARNYGVSASAAENAAGTFGQMLHSMGKGPEEAAHMSTKMAELAQNVAKFNNADPTTVQAAFVAALRGRGKALAQLGINLDTTAISAEALRHGIVHMTADSGKVAAAQDKYNAALDKLHGLTGKARDTTEAHRVAVQRLQIAEDTLARVRNSNGSTNVQREKAELAVSLAQQKVTKTATSDDHARQEALHKVAEAHDALKNAMGGVIPKLTQSQKGEATYYAILDNTKNQQNAVAKTTDTLAQRKRILGAEVTNLEAKIGMGLFPIMSSLARIAADDVVPAISAVGGWIKHNADWLKPLVLILGSAVAAYKLVSGVSSLAGKAMQFFGIGAAEAAAATEGETVAQQGLNGAMRANPIGLVVAALAMLVAGFVYAWNHSKTFRTIVTGAFNAVKGVVLAVVNWFRHDFLDFFTQTIPHAWHSLVNGITGAWDTVVGFLKRWGPTALLVLAPFIGIPLFIVRHFRQIVGWLRDVWDTVWGDVTGFVKKIVGAVASIPGAIVNIGGDMVKAGAHLMGALFDGIKNALGAAGSFALDLAKDIWNGIVGFINKFLIDPVKNFHFTVSIGPWDHTFQPFGSFPEVPMLARGGMTNGLTPAILGDNPSGREAVLPLDSPRTVSALASALGQAGRVARPHSSASGQLSVAGGQLHIAPDSAGRLRAWVSDIVLDETGFEAGRARMRAS